MEEIIPNGTEVLIFRYIREWKTKQDDEHFIMGIIQSSNESDDLSHHGSSYYEQIYKVLGVDGKKYIGTYGHGLTGNYIFRTREDYIRVLKNKIKNNNEEILKIQSKNDEYENQINLLISNEDITQNKLKILKDQKLK